MASPRQSNFKLSPVHKEDDVWLKRDDLWFKGLAHGSKCKVGFDIIGSDPEAVVGGSHRTSPQAERIALLGHELGVEAHVHTAAAAQRSDIVKRCEELGAIVHEHRPGYMNVILKRAADHAAQLGVQAVPWGMEAPQYIEAVRRQVRNVPDEVERLVVPLGSGMALSSILHGLDDFDRDIPVLAVSVGSQTFYKRMNQWAPDNWQERVECVKSTMSFEHMEFEEIGGAKLDPQYEAKCVEFLEPGDLLWCVAHRDHPLERDYQRFA